MIKNNFVNVKGLDCSEIISLPLELDDTLLFEVLTSQFPYATELKSINKKNDQIRTVRKTDGKFFLSHGMKWDEFVFFCSCSHYKKKIRIETELTGIRPKQRETVQSIHTKFPITFDLLAVGLSYDTTEEGLFKYLSRFGELLYCTLKIDDVTKESRGTAYLRFKETVSQNKCLNATHLVDKTKIVIKIPKEKVLVRDVQAFKLFLFNITPNLSREDLRAYFSQFGLVINIFRPYDNRNFAYITYGDQESIDRTLAAGHYHTFNGGRVSVNRMFSKEDIDSGVKPSIKITAQLANKTNALKRINKDTNEIIEIKEKILKITPPIVQKMCNLNPKLNEKKQETSQNEVQYIANQQSIVPAYNQPYYSPNNFPRVYDTSYPPPNLFPYPPQHFVNQMQTSSYYGDNAMPNPFSPSTSSALPSYPPIMYDQPPIHQVPHFDNNPCVPQNTSNKHPETVPVNPSVNGNENQNQLKDLVNMFIQEIRNTFNNLSNA